MLEWTASVTIAIEPVAAPATSFSTIRAELDAIDSRAALSLRPGSSRGSPVGGCAAGWTASASGRLTGPPSAPPAPRARRRAPERATCRAPARRGRSRLRQRVLREGGAGLVGERDVLRQRHELVAREERVELAQLVLVARCDHELHRACSAMPLPGGRRDGLELGGPQLLYT